MKVADVLHDLGGDTESLPLRENYSPVKIESIRKADERLTKGYYVVHDDEGDMLEQFGIEYDLDEMKRELHKVARMRNDANKFHIVEFAWVKLFDWQGMDEKDLLERR